MTNGSIFFEKNGRVSHIKTTAEKDIKIESRRSIIIGSDYLSDGLLPHGFGVDWEKRIKDQEKISKGRRILHRQANVCSRRTAGKRKKYSSLSCVGS